MAIKEIELDITVAEHAREYIKDFCLPGIDKKIEWINFSSDGETIVFKKMTDHQAIRAAHGLRELLVARIKELKMVMN
jgi:hypothetical protein